MKRVKYIIKTSPACPEQYEGKLETGELFYARCRFGEAELRIGNQQQWDNWELPTKETISYRDEPLRGAFQKGDLEKLFVFAGILLDIPIDENIADRDRRARAMMQKLQQKLQQTPASSDGVTFLTLDEDILHGKLSHEKLKLLIDEAKAIRNGKIDTPRF